MSPKGAHIVKGDPVERLSSEGALDQILGISVDDNQNDLVFLDSVTDEDDVFRRCPVIGEIDCTRILDEESIKQILDEISYLTRNLYLNSSNGTLSKYDSGSTVDKFAVSDAKWINDPRRLIWKSHLLAQLQARRNAITHYLNDPASADYTGKLSDEEKRQLSQRARQLADELQDSALKDMSSACDASVKQYQQAARSSKKRFLSYVVTDEEAIKQGGLTAPEVDELFEEG
jgi:hypothetical protein